MKVLAQGSVIAKLAQTPAELQQAQALRRLAFHAARGRRSGDADPYDARADHILVTDRESGALRCCFRVQGFTGESITQSYAAQFYDLTALQSFDGPMLEIGRFCLHPDCHDPDVLRLAWAAVARLVDQRGVVFLFGCSSFVGADPSRHSAGLGALYAHIAPRRWRPLRRAAETVDLADHAGRHSAREASGAIPALLRSYLGLGARVSDHAVIDRQLDTLHVLTGVEIAAIPPARARALRAIGGN